ncbi:MAG TPA: hypothetical protein VGX25_04345 [Actinophytocola sp.]|uniref:hypothetical protein n=1 Tax=Actinophytocola sp. TaxID=1872138 RepID=UPI002DDD3EE1|nr:hypothetical protein [Actinophytocola sp.]HEV2778610.1 hypothetical protein [Actinophytocola sp.]
MECRDRLENDLVGLPTWYESCADYLDYRHHRFVERVNGRQPRGIVLSDAVVTIRSDILSTLASWCSLVVDERGVVGPNQLDIRALATFLVIHFTWLTAYPAAPDLVDELADLTEAARGVVLPSNHFRTEVGVCDQPGCGQMVYAESYSEEDQVPYRVACEAGHAWPPDQWLLLRGRLGRNGAGPEREQPAAGDVVE